MAGPGERITRRQAASHNSHPADAVTRHRASGYMGGVIPSLPIATNLAPGALASVTTKTF